MPDFSVGSYLAGDVCRFHDVASERHPDGKTYVVQPPSAEDEIRLRRFIRLQSQSEDGTLSGDALAELTTLVTGKDGEPVDLGHKLLGATYQEMVDDGVRPTHIDMLGGLVMTTYGMSAGSAQMVVTAAAGEARAAANRAERRAAAKKTPAKKAAARKRPSSLPKDGPNSSPASTAALAQSPASTRTRSTSAAKKAAARKAS